MTTDTYLVPDTTDWNDPAAWSPNVVPDAPDADVVIPTNPVSSGVTIAAGESFQIGALSQPAGNTALYLEGALTVAGAANVSNLVLDGGTLTAGSLINQDLGYYGSVIVTGALDNAGIIEGSPQYPNVGLFEGPPSTLTITAGSLTNTGTIDAQKDNETVIVTVTGGPGSATNLSGNALTGGEWSATFGGTLDLDLGATITTDAATILIDGDPLDPPSVIASYDSATGAYQPLQATLTTIAAAGSFDLYSVPSFTVANAFTIAGALNISGSTFAAPAGLTVTPGGSIQGPGAIAATIDNNGTITATSGILTLSGPVSGSGLLVVGAGNSANTAPALLELTASATNTVQFLDGAATLQLDSPATFTGAIIPAAPTFRASVTASPTQPAIATDQILLAGIALSAVTAQSYSGSTASGTLTLTEAATQQTLVFSGDVTTASFALSAGPTIAGQPSLDISVTPVPSAPTLGSGSPGLITNGSISGATPAGATVAVAVDGAPLATTETTTAGASTATFTATGAALTPGAHVVTASASNAAGSAAATPVSLYELPAPVDGDTIVDLSSFNISALLGQGYSDQFMPATQEVLLTNGAISTGEDTIPAYVERLFEGLLARPGAPSDISAFSTLLTDGATTAQIAGYFLQSPEYQADYGSQTPTQLVTSLYQGLLGRTPSASEAGAWIAQLNQAQLNQAQLNQGPLTPADVTAEIALSAEAQGHLAATTANIWVPSSSGILITGLYQTALDRVPDLPNLAAWQQQLAAGLTPLQLAQAITGSAEYAIDHAGQGPDALVTEFYQTALGRTPAAPELAGWLGQLNAGASTASVLLGIATSPEAPTRLAPPV